MTALYIVSCVFDAFVFIFCLKIFWEKKIKRE